MKRRGAGGPGTVIQRAIQPFEAMVGSQTIYLAGKRKASKLYIISRKVLYSTTHRILCRACVNISLTN